MPTTKNATKVAEGRSKLRILNPKPVLEYHAEHAHALRRFDCSRLSEEATWLCSIRCACNCCCCFCSLFFLLSLLLLLLLLLRLLGIVVVVVNSNTVVVLVVTHVVASIRGMAPLRRPQPLRRALCGRSCAKFRLGQAHGYGTFWGLGLEVLTF